MAGQIPMEQGVGGGGIKSSLNLNNGGVIVLLSDFWLRLADFR